MSRDDEFYIGYETEVPQGVLRHVRIAVVLGALALAGVALLLTVAERPLAPSAFDYGHHQSWAGLIVRTPAPALLVPTGAGYRRFWLVGRGKHGADGAIAAIADGWATVTGTEIARDPWRMIEVVSAAPTTPPRDAAGPPASADDSGREVTVRGEIVDGKCFLGVMNPGERIVHRDCAIRCLSGGIPPLIAYVTDGGDTELAVLVDAHGRLLHDAVHDAVGRAVTARGRLFTVNGQPVFQLASLAGAAR